MVQRASQTTNLIGSNLSFPFLSTNFQTKFYISSRGWAKIRVLYAPNNLRNGQPKEVLYRLIFVTKATSFTSLQKNAKLFLVSKTLILNGTFIFRMYIGRYLV
jgi:hypothetical protein